MMELEEGKYKPPAELFAELFSLLAWQGSSNIRLMFQHQQACRPLNGCGQALFWLCQARQR